jgi:SAM-dependent methyltransferase
MAAGTGITTQFLISAARPAGSVYLVDSSAAMLDHARRRLGETGFEYILSQAEDLSDKLNGKQFDSVVCSCALWQMDLARLFRCLNEIVVIGGQFVANLPEGTLGLLELESAPNASRQFRRLISSSQICNLALDNGFNLSESQAYFRTTTCTEFLAFFEMEKMKLSNRGFNRLGAAQMDEVQKIELITPGKPFSFDSWRCLKFTKSTST